MCETIRIMLEKDKEQARKVKEGVNWAVLRENPGESDNHYSQVDVENEGENGYRDNWGGVRLAM